MREPSHMILTRLQVLQKSTAYTVDLCTAVILGGATNRHNAMALLPNALQKLHAHVCEAIQELEGSHV
jgi:hypothetical protein